jgi:hypothetical protein
MIVKRAGRVGNADLLTAFFERGRVRIIIIITKT